MGGMLDLLGPPQGGAIELSVVSSPCLPFLEILMPKPRSDTALTDADPVLQGPAYEAAMQELEQLVGSMESGNMPLDQLLSSYQRGAVLLQLCRDRLQAVEDQIKVLDNGAIKPWKGA